MYKAIDEGARNDREVFLDGLIKNKLFDITETAALRDPDKTKSDVMVALLGKHVPNALSELPPETVEMELIRHGYDPAALGQIPAKIALDKIILLEKRCSYFSGHSSDVASGVAN